MREVLVTRMGVGKSNTLTPFLRCSIALDLGNEMP